MARPAVRGSEGLVDSNGGHHSHGERGDGSQPSRSVDRSRNPCIVRGRRQDVASFSPAKQDRKRSTLNLNGQWT